MQMKREKIMQVYGGTPVSKDLNGWIAVQDGGQNTCAYMSYEIFLLLSLSYDVLCGDTSKNSCEI